MVSINSITSSLVAKTQGLDPVAPTSAPESSTSAAPAFQETLTTQNRAFALGLGAPRNHGDIEALFAEIATKFGAEVTKASDFAEAAEDAKRSTSLRAAAGNLGLIAALGAAIKDAEDNIAKQNRVIAEKTEQINALNGQISALEDQYDQYRSEWNDNAAKQLSNAGRIIELGFDLAGAELAGDDAEADRIRAEISQLESENSTLFNRNLYLDGEMLRISGEIIELGFQVAGLEIERGWAELSKLGSQAQISFAEGLLQGLALIFIPFSVDLALRMMGESGRASFEITADQAGLDKAIEDAASNISDQAQRMGEIENARRALGMLPANDPATLSAINDFLAGKGVPGVEGADPAVDAEAVIGLMTLLRQMLSDGVPAADMGQDPVSDSPPNPGTAIQGNAETGQRATPSAFELVRQALESTLPPENGDPDKVSSEAAGLAVGLSLLRNILGQVANGESSTGTQVPGPSGRLNLAI